MPFVSCITLLFTFFSSTCKKISVRILVRFLFIYCVYSCFISPFTFFSSLDFEGLDSQRVGSPSPPLPHQVRIFLTKIFAFVYIRYFCFNHCLLFLPFLSVKVIQIDAFIVFVCLCFSMLCLILNSIIYSYFCYFVALLPLNDLS